LRVDDVIHVGIGVSLVVQIHVATGRRERQRCATETLSR